ncbi:MAG: hypothetical protein ACOY58_01170 [Candidatus Micrarchaeota archaeon]
MMAAMASAFGVQADYLDVKDTGNENLEPLSVAIFIDCDMKNITAEIKGQESEEPIAGASAYLFYTDYEYQLIATGNSDPYGMARIDVLGNRDYLTALFILRIDKSGYRSREIEFSYQNCFEPPPETEAPPPGEEEPPVADLPEEEAPVVKAPAEEVAFPEDDEGAPADESPLQDEEAPEPGPAPSACHLGLALIPLLFLKAKR